MDFLKFSDITKAQLHDILSLSSKLKSAHKQGKKSSALSGKTLLMLFAKNSTRTRVSFEAAMAQLGGHAIFLSIGDSQGSRGETLYDTGAAAGSMVDFMMARVHSHSGLEELALGSPSPVINGLSDLEHPCQALADLLTLSELGLLAPGSKIAYVGDCRNNVANSLIISCAMAGVGISLCGPEQFSPLPSYMEVARGLGIAPEFSTDPQEALRGAGAVYTDTWISMGDEHEASARLEALSPYQVDAKMMSFAKKGAAFMHCLPAHRGQEVSAEVLDGAQSAVFAQAENRLHAQKGLLAWLSKNSVA